MRRSVLTALAILCDLTGMVWILQGIGVLPGSFMTGDVMWAAIGAVLQNQLATSLTSEAVTYSQQLPAPFRQPFVDGFTSPFFVQ